MTWADVQKQLRPETLIYQEVRAGTKIIFLPLKVVEVREDVLLVRYPDHEVIALIPQNFPHENLYLEE